MTQGMNRLADGGATSHELAAFIESMRGRVAEPFTAPELLPILDRRLVNAQRLSQALSKHPLVERDGFRDKRRTYRYRR